VPVKSLGKLSSINNLASKILLTGCGAGNYREKLLVNACWFRKKVAGWVAGRKYLYTLVDNNNKLVSVLVNC
jgi:hypothetical protein